MRTLLHGSTGSGFDAVTIGAVAAVVVLALVGLILWRRRSHGKA